eukprot:TRINITY_DN6095_c0_g1_i1.p1 TRINITY_DN6095_c0_g1~~TRINITY_DN6095_c0_g1_i1.p1  ORF type:complete len:80 (-),score=7.08 TRINITY_DN6095_c0_g1_i1:117-356(-)
MSTYNPLYSTCGVVENDKELFIMPDVHPEYYQYRVFPVTMWCIFTVVWITQSWRSIVWFKNAAERTSCITRQWYVSLDI